MKCKASLVLAILFLAAPVWADSLVHNGKTYNNVYVREGNSSYYVQDPATGSVAAIPKTEVAPGGVTISSDANARQALLNQWKSARPDKPVPAMAATMQAAVTAAVSVPPAAPAPAHRAPAKSGNVNVKLKNVPLRDALRVTLRSQNLDYQVRDNYIYVSTPQRLRQEALEGLQSRAYSVAGATASDTLPKVVVRNPAANGYGGGMGGYGGMGMGGGMGMQGAGMGMGGGYGLGGGGMGGGMGGYGMGGGMGGMGMRGGMMGGGQSFSNISDLFSTIDDRLVGETPAVIGIGGISTGQSGATAR